MSSTYVLAPDNTYVEFPAGMKDEDISAAMAKSFPAPSLKARVQNQGTIGPQGSPDQQGAANNLRLKQAIMPKAGESSLHYHPLDAMSEAGRQALSVTDPWEKMTPEGRAEHPVKAYLGDKTQSLKELLFGGQAAGKPMGSTGGAADVAALLSAPKALEDLATLPSRIREGGTNAVRRLVRGPSGTEPVTVNPGTMASRELEEVIPKTPPEYNQAHLPSTEEFDERRIAGEAAHEKRLKEVVAERQKELADAEKLKEQDAAARQRRGAAQEELDEDAAQRRRHGEVPFEPLVYSSEHEPAQIAQRMKNIDRQAKSAGKYHAAQGSVKKPLTLQERIAAKYGLEGDE